MRPDTITAMTRIGSLVRDARRHRGLTQQQLADRLGTSQSAIARIEQGNQNLTLELLGRLSAALDSELITLGPTGPTHLRVTGGTPLQGSVTVKSSKNAAVALLCASLLNRGRTTLRNVARIVEVDRILDVLRSIGVSATWDDAGPRPDARRPRRAGPGRRSTPTPPGAPAASSCSWARCCTGRTTFALPYAGGCDLGTRTVQPHMIALRPFGLDVEARAGEYHATVQHTGRPAPDHRPDRARGHRHRERAAGRRPHRRHDDHPQRQLQLHGPGPLPVPAAARRRHRGPRDDDARRPRPAGARRRRRLHDQRGPGRGDEPAHRGHRHRLGAHRAPGADRLPGDRARRPRRDGAALRAVAGVPRRQRAHPAGRHHDLAVGAEGADRQDPPDAVPGPQHRQPAVLRGHRGARPRARRSSTTGSTTTGRSTCPT